MTELDELLEEIDIPHNNIEKYAEESKNHDWFNKQKDEEILLWNHPTRLELIPPLLVSMMVVAGSLYLAWASFLGIYGYLGIPIAVLMITYAFLSWENTHYVVTTKRVIKKDKIFRPDPTEKDFSDVDSIDPKQGKENWVVGLIEVTFNFGEIYIRSDSATILFNNVPMHNKYHQAISLLNSKNSMREVIKNQTENMMNKQGDDNAGET